MFSDQSVGLCYTSSPIPGSFSNSYRRNCDPTEPPAIVRPPILYRAWFWHTYRLYIRRLGQFWWTVPDAPFLHMKTAYNQVQKFRATGYVADSSRTHWSHLWQSGRSGATGTVSAPRAVTTALAVNWNNAADGHAARLHRHCTLLTGLNGDTSLAVRRVYHSAWRRKRFSTSGCLDWNCTKHERI